MKKRILTVLILMITMPAFAEYTAKDKAYWNAKEKYATLENLQKLDTESFTEEQIAAIGESFNYDIRYKTEAEAKAQIYNSMDIYVIQIMEDILAEKEAEVAALKAIIA